jgi:hypothetical protein
MRVAYLVIFRGGRDTGIYRKVREHVTEWSRRGVEVGLFVATDTRGATDWAAIGFTQAMEVLPGRALLSILARERLASALRRWHPDVVYARHGLAYPGFVRVAKTIPTVIEVNADDISEFKATSVWRHAYSRSSRAILLRSVAGFVFVTHELAGSPGFAPFHKPSAVIGNGIDLKAFPMVPPPKNDRPRLLFLGHPRSPWHGLDHVAELAKAFPAGLFDVVGPSADEVSDVPSNMTFHGLMNSDAYWPILERADVAIGTLALYRNRMEEASPLKVREYLARGIPTIIGYQDTDFPDPHQFLLQVPNRADGIVSSIDAIVGFVERSRGVRVPRAAVTRLDVSIKEEARLEFLGNAANSRTSLA